MAGSFFGTVRGWFGGGSESDPGYVFRLTPRCAQQMRMLMRQQKMEKAYIALAVLWIDDGSWPRYKLGLELIEGKRLKDYVVLTSEGLPLAIEREGSEYLRDGSVDWVDDGERKGFLFDVPFFKERGLA